MAQFVELEKCFVNLDKIAWISKYDGAVYIHFFRKTKRPIPVAGKDMEKLLRLLPTIEKS